MDQFKLIVYLCNWGPHAAYQELQDRCADIPSEIKMVRVPCAGRINKSLLFKPFEMGADGVLLIGCSPGSCRYGTGTENSRQNTEDTRKILGLLGIQENRLQRETFLPDEPDRLLDYLKKFSRDIKAMGKSPVSKKQMSADVATPTVPEILNRYDVYACQDCGKCTSACPLALAGKAFSPRAIASSVITGDMDSQSFKDSVWSCLTCGVCYERCPSAVNFPEFIRDLRQVLKAEDENGHEVHGGFFQSLMRTMTAENLNLNRWSLPSEIKTDPKSNVLFFGGCNPYFDTFFNRHLGVKTSNITLDSLRLLNFFDVIPAVLPNERCCGHDLLWTGDITNFKRLAKLNAEMMCRLEITEIITACPECFRTLAHDYKEHGFELPFQVTHIYDFLEREIGKGAVKFKPFSTPVTFQDSCRMSRFEGRPDLPRTLLKRMQPENFSEMQDSGRSAICCGNSGWIGCDAYSKALQVKRLKQARATGSEMLLTACPKCQVHLKCAMEDPFKADGLNFEIRDLVSVIAETICWE